MGQFAHARREDIVRAAVTRWTSELVDLSRRNNLLYFKDLKTGTLDFADADGAVLTKFLTGTKVRASLLFTDERTFARARKSLLELRRRTRSLAEERGIETGHVASGMVSWLQAQGTGAAKETRSPILLRKLTITSRGQRSADFDLELDESAVLNPVLVFALARLAGVDTSGLTDAVSLRSGDGQFETAVAMLDDRARAAGKPIELDLDKTVAGVFAYEKLPMVEDLENSAALLARHELVSVLAGDEEARARAQSWPIQSIPDLNDIAPEQEHLVLDADPSQQGAIARILAGQSVIMQGPPGTGKSQTIANLLAEATAQGKKVLFVAQKRAAIDAVVNNLRRTGLEDIVLDLHDPKTSRKAIAEQLGTSMERAGQQPSVDVSELNRRLRTRRSELSTRSQEMSRLRSPYGRSIIQLHEELADLDPVRDVGVTLPRAALERLSYTALWEHMDELKKFVEADGLRLWRGGSPWSKAQAITERGQAAELRERLDTLTGGGLNSTRQLLAGLLAQSGLPRPTTVAQWGEALTLLADVSRTCELYGHEVFDAELAERRAAVATGSWRRQHNVSLGFWRRRALRRTAKVQRVQQAPTEAVFKELSGALSQQSRWAQLTGGRQPHPVPGVLEALDVHGRLRADLAALGAAVLSGDLTLRPEPEMDHQLRELKADEDVLDRLPELNQQRQRFQAAGLADVLDRLAASEVSPDDAAESLRYSWLSSALRALRTEVPEYAHFTAESQERVIEDFRVADSEHVRRAADRVRRRLAESQVSARDKWPEEARVLRDQVRRKRPNLSMRQLVDRAPNLLLEVRPCWAMSPLVVSQVLPGRELFDVVVFDEASQIEPADAIPAIARGRTVAVAGDSKQLPPTAFFSKMSEEDDGEGEDENLNQFSSILDLLARELPATTLRWHYRSADDRLIAFSNRHVYGDQLVTFPSTFRDPPVRHVRVDAVAAPGGRAMAAEEIDKVVALAVDHAERRPSESLGVIALGVGAQQRILHRLNEFLENRADLAAFFTEDAVTGRAFFVKNLESVQGDERDAIILSLGGAKSASGVLNHNFGPINHDGGERRLNVAVSRARKRMTVVSTFGHEDFDDSKVNREGLRFLRGYLRFAANGGTPSGNNGSRSSALERAVARQLRAAGVRVVEQHGASSSRIAIAAEHARQPGRLLLAIEVDDEDYHAPGQNVRERDRLRPGQLERMGWRHHRVWTPDWHRDPHTQVARLIAELEEAAAKADGDTEGDHHVVVASENAGELAPVQQTEQRRLPRPAGLTPGLPIDHYSSRSLVDLAAWIDSDDLLRDEDQMLQLMMAELGFRRRGSRIQATLERAIRTARRRG
jgi:hypothetical protein